MIKSVETTSLQFSTEIWPICNDVSLTIQTIDRKIHAYE